VSIVKQGVDRVDVIVGVAVAGRVARLAMIGSPASGGQVFDQYALDLVDDAMTDLVDTIGGTYRAVAVSGHRVAATRLCLPDAFAADALRQTVLSAGVQNVEVVAEADAAAALARSVGADAVLLLADDDTVSLTVVGEDEESESVLASVPIGAAGAAVACAAVLQQVPSAAATRIMLVGQRLDLDSIAAELRSTAPVEVPSDAGYAIARGAAQTADDSESPAGAATLMAQAADPAAVGPELAYSQEAPDDYEMPADSIEEFIPEHEDEAPYTALIALPPPRTLLMASALAFAAMAVATLAVTVAVAIRPAAPIEAHPAPTVQSDTVPGRYLPPVPHEPDPVALPLAVLSPPPAAPAAPSVPTNRGLVNNALSAPAPRAPAGPAPVPPAPAPAAPPAPKGPPPAPPAPALQVPVVPIPPVIILPPLNPFPLPTFPTPSTTVTAPTTTSTTPTTTMSAPTTIPATTSPQPTTSSEPSTIPSSPSAIVTSTPEPKPSAAQEPAYARVPAYTPPSAPDYTQPAFAPEPTSAPGIEAPAPPVQELAPAVEAPSSGGSDSSSDGGSSDFGGSDSSSGSEGSVQEPETIMTESP
jgi:hypothetical protein